MEGEKGGTNNLKSQSEYLEIDCKTEGDTQRCLQVRHRHSTLTATCTNQPQKNSGVGGGGGVTNNLKSKSECLEINHEIEDETAVLACASSTFHHDRKLMWRGGGGWIGKGGEEGGN